MPFFFSKKIISTVEPLIVDTLRKGHCIVYIYIYIYNYIYIYIYIIPLNERHWSCYCFHTNQTSENYKGQNPIVYILGPKVSFPAFPQCVQRFHCIYIY